MPAIVQKHPTPTPLSETRHVYNPNEKYPEKTKPVKLRSSSSIKDPRKHSHRSSKREEYAEYYDAKGEVSRVRSKTQKERTKHRTRDKGGEVASAEQKPVDFKPINLHVIGQIHSLFGVDLRTLVAKFCKTTPLGAENLALMGVLGAKNALKLYHYRWSYYNPGCLDAW
ncbi:hypothetical protein HanIR_Chr15g0779781 [Helianthus annuus]|nr:hypothetical protein HanIR_Chr15g0779781 [Helianthus annuus]